MDSARELAPVLEQFLKPGSAYRAKVLGNAGGFSGARLWRIAAGERTLCLRRWPAGHPDDTRLRFIHAVMEFAGMQIDFVPKLQRTTATGETAVRLGDHLWELTTWLPGTADFHQRPTPARLAAAMRALAQVHIALELFPTRMTGTSTSPGLVERKAMISGAQAHVLPIRSSLPNVNAELRVRAEPILRYFERHAAAVKQLLEQSANLCIPLQPCLRDVWHDHVLFTGDDVTGIVDFDAARIETVAGDIARLLGSLVGDNPAQRAEGLAAYQSLRSLSADEQSLIETFDASAVLMSGMNWLMWLIVDEDHFPDMDRVYARLDEALARIRFREGIGLWQST